MYIKSLELCEFKRFSLLDIHLLEYTPNQVNMILATNGAGKSSLLNELSPIPPDRKDFDVGGYKIIIIEYNNYKFKLTSEDGKHSFVMNDNELNLGRTQKVQLHLIEEHLHVTPFLMSFIMGGSKFTKMSPSERKDLFSTMSTISYTYAFGVFNKAKIRLRDLTGALKIDTKKLSTMESSTVSKEKYEELVNIKNVYNTLLNNVRISMVNTEDIDNPIFKLKDLVSQYKKIESLPRTKIIDTTYVSDDIKKTKRQYQKVIDDISELKEQSLINVSDINKDIIYITNEIKELEDSNVFRAELENVILFVRNNFDTLRHYTNDYITKYIEFTQDELNMIIKYKNESFELLSSLKNRREKLRGELNILNDNKSKDNVSCPSCEYVFKIGYSDDALENVKLNLVDINNKIDILEEKYHKIEDRYGEINSFSTARECLTHFLSRYNSLYRYITDGNVETNMNMLNQLLDKLSSLPNLNIKLKELNDKLNIATISNDVNTDMINSTRDALIDKANRLREEISKLEADKRSHDRINQIILTRDKILNDIEMVSKEVEMYMNNEIDKIKNSSYTNIIDSVNVELIEIEDKIREYEQTSLVIDTLRESINDYGRRIKVSKSIVDGLSPNDGIIAKSISGFIGVFLNIINSIIREIWSYKLEIQFDISDSLTYKFPVLVEDDLKEDISKVSSGMHEIINLACVIATMRMMKMELPIFLDEFGAALDVEHRRKAIDLIKSLISNGNQTFVISHYNDVIYPITSMNNTSTIILSSNNIDMSNITSYNERLEIK